MNNKKILIVAGAILVLGLVGGAAFFMGKGQTPQTSQPTPTVQTTPSPAVTDTPTPTTTLAVTPTPSPTKKPTPTPTTASTPTPTPAPGVTNIEDSVSPTSSSACNDTFTFTGKIYTNAAATVTYRWLRSDNASGTTQTLTFTSASMQTVTNTWTLGQDSGNHYNGWERIEVLTPNSTLGNQAAFTISCP